MNDTDLGRRFRATAVFAGMGSGLVMILIVLFALVSLVLGDSIGLGGFLRTLLLGGAVGALGGSLFAGGLSLLGRREGRDRLSYKTAMIAGASATFLAPLLLGIVLFAPQSVPILKIVIEYTGEAWWLLGLGAGCGFGLNRVARGATLNSGDRPEEITSGDPFFADGDS